MLHTKKALIGRIHELEQELETKREKDRVSAFIDSSKLPKCESLACVRCEHIIYRELPGRTFAKRDAEELERNQAVNDAADQILAISSQLNLTWGEFERAISLVKERGRIR